MPLLAPGLLHFCYKHPYSVFRFPPDVATLSNGSTGTVCDAWRVERVSHCRVDSRLAPSQWETVLLYNDVSHWLGASLQSALSLYTCQNRSFAGGCGPILAQFSHVYRARLIWIVIRNNISAHGVSNQDGWNTMGTKPFFSVERKSDLKLISFAKPGTRGICQIVSRYK